jgi:hypothetical protein
VSRAVASDLIYIGRRDSCLDLSKIRRERYLPEFSTNDFVFSQEEYEFVHRELKDCLHRVTVEKSENGIAPMAFRAGFEAGIASDDDVEEALAKFLAKYTNMKSPEAYTYVSNALDQLFLLRGKCKISVASEKLLYAAEVALTELLDSVDPESKKKG